MSLQAILRAIQASGESQVGEIELHAYTQVQQILVDAHLEAQQEKDDAFVAASAPAYRERSRIIHHARLEALRITGTVLESLVEATLDQARGRLQGLRLETIYPTVLRRLTQTALAELEGSLEGTGKVRLSADPRDKTLLTSILQDMGLHLQVGFDLDRWGGLIARSEDGRVVVINTLEARLERAIPYLRRYLSAFFEGGFAEVKSEQVPENASMV